METQENKMCCFTIGILLVVSVLSITFGIMMFQTNLDNTYQNLMHSGLTDAIQKIRYGISYGKSIDKYYGVEDLIQDTADKSEYIDELSVTGGNKNLLYQTQDQVQDKAQDHVLPDEILSAGEGGMFKDKKSLYVSFQLTDHSNIIAQMGTAELDGSLKAFSFKLAKVAAIGSLVTAVCIAALYIIHGKGKRRGKAPLFLVVLWIVALGAYVGGVCWKEYRLSQEMLRKGIESSVHADIQRLQGQGIPYGELAGTEEYLNLYADNIPEFNRIYLENGELKYEVSRQYMRSVFIQYLLNTILLSIISILIVAEYQLFLGRREEQNQEYRDAQKMIRVAVFVLYACISIGKSMNAVVSGRLAQDIHKDTGWFADMLTSMPASAAMLGSILGILISGIAAVRLKKMKRYLQLTAIFAVAGLAVCAASGSLYVFLAARAVLGFCEGLLFMGIRNYGFRYTDSKSRTKALAYITGGGFGGICLGSVAGGMLSDHLPYRAVFLIAAACVLGAIPMAASIKDGFQEKKTAARLPVLAVARNLAAVRYLICLVFPVYAGAVFLDYVLPLAGEGLGFSHTAVSALILFNCLIAGYASPKMTEFVMKKMSPVNGAILYCVLYGGLILSYAVLGNALLLVFVTLALGVCDSFGLMMISEGFVQTKGKSMYQNSEANIIFTMVSRFGQLAAPIGIAWYGGCGILACMSAAGLGAYGATGLIGSKKGKSG